MLKSAKFMILLVSLLVIFQHPSSLKASHKIFMEDLTGYEGINSNSIVYPLKRLDEEIRLFLTFDKKEREKYFYILFEKRFNELVYIINFDKTGFLFETVDRYNSFAGKFKADYQIKEEMRENISHHVKILEKLRDRYHSASPYWKKIQEALDVTRALL